MRVPGGCAFARRCRACEPSPGRELDHETRVGNDTSWRSKKSYVRRNERRALYELLHGPRTSRAWVHWRARGAQTSCLAVAGAVVCVNEKSPESGKTKNRPAFARRVLLLAQLAMRPALLCIHFLSKEIIMKYVLITLVSAATLGVSLPASAAPSQGKVCPPQTLILPLDHGPRAQSTPYLNQQRKARYDAEVKACKDTAK